MSLATGGAVTGDRCNRSPASMARSSIILAAGGQGRSVPGLWLGFGRPRADLARSSASAQSATAGVGSARRAKLDVKRENALG